MSSIIQDIAENRIDNVSATITGSGVSSIISAIGGKDAKIETAITQLVKDIAEFQQNKNPIELQCAFALKRDLTNRYASRKLMHQAALDKELYFGVIQKTLGETAKTQFESEQ